MSRPPIPLEPSRHTTALWAVVPWLATCLVVRAALLAVDADPENADPARLAAIFATGALYDVATAAWIAAPLLLLSASVPDGPRWSRLHGALSFGLVTALAAAFATIAVAEVLFWNEFSSRFNFIAVDYLVYSREVLGNIRESYPVLPILAGIALAALAFAMAIRVRFLRTATAGAGTVRVRAAVVAVAATLPSLSWFGLDEGLRERLPTPSARELAGNGAYAFAHAFRSNDLDFRAFYPVLPDDRARSDLVEEFTESHSTARFVADGHPLAREVGAVGTEKRLNVVLVSIESLGADYVESLGGKPGLTPNLDRLARDGLVFTNVYATGLRTVRGLEALTLSLPPTPGHAVPMRPRNKGLQTLGGVFREKGYDALYVYGGYSGFDNMRDFFGGNGYEVVDRTALARSEISHETVWGVADEDLFQLALLEIDKRVAQGHRVFAHVMTTSNHRPFTYPAGRIDVPSGSGRDGAVKYTDYAIGRFVEAARTRPWFDETLFVFVADHTSHGRGRIDLPPENYRIPLVVYAPAHVAPAVVDHLASQIDVAPTLLALLHLGYTSRFFGQDILSEGRSHQRAFMANYLTVGYFEKGMIVELSPGRRTRVVDAATGRAIAADGEAGHLAEEAIAYYQVAADVVHGPAAHR